MADFMATFTRETINVALELTALESQRQTGRHIEWIRRRLREAVKFVSEHNDTHPDYKAYHTLAWPVFMNAAQLGGMTEVGAIN